MLRHIEELAERILKETDCYVIPINVIKCAMAKNIELKAVELESNVSGFFVIKNNKSHIGYNNKHPESRVRFTIAHELGHYLLHSSQVPVFIDKAVMYRNMDSSSGEVQKEREANAFAAALLMPQTLIKKEMESYSSDTAQSIVEYLAAKFNVSDQAMTFRLANLGLIDFGHY